MKIFFFKVVMIVMFILVGWVKFDNVFEYIEYN